MELHVQVVHRAISSVDRLIDRTLLVEPLHVQAPAASVEKVKHWPDSVPESFGLFSRKAWAFDADTVYRFSIRPSSSVRLR